ncbi:MAG: pirin family protein [Myxococcales bacterium]|nr:pirin family protein [Myxococcales bacterium]
MMMLRRADERGRANFGWLDSRHTFSFGHYYDPRHMGFSTLRVINDDRVTGGGGFPTHPHRDMEIISYVVEGALEHEDSMGNGSVIRAGDVQRMSAGTGVRHSEYNHSKTAPVRFLQIWIVPEARGVEPGYAQRNFDAELVAGNGLRLLVSRDGEDGSLTVNQDVRLYGARLAAGEKLVHELDIARNYWLQIVRGEAKLGEQALVEGDGVAISEEQRLALTASDATELLLFDLQ